MWGAERAPELAAIVAAALPGEELSVEELAATCWPVAVPHVVLGIDGVGVVAASTQQHGDRTVAFVTLIAVVPDAQRGGHGRALLDAAHVWASEHGATEVRVAGPGPFYVWPGVDVALTPALCFFESAGYFVTGAEVNMACATTYRAPVPDGVAVQRVVGNDVEATVAFVERQWPWWVAEVERAVESGCCHAARGADGAVIGFACHSVNRAGWVGPMGTDPGRQTGGVGAALLGAVCRDLELAEFALAEIAWVGPVGFYAKAAGATVSRTFRTFSRRLPA